MQILALDTSSLAASCAYLQGETLRGEYFANIGLTHSQTAMPMVKAMLEGMGIGPDAPDLFAVTVGPGSFTGLRIGIALVKGMALATGKPCAGVSTLEALAWNLPGFGGVVVPVMDARRDQVYTAAFLGGEALPRRLTEDAALSLDRLEALVGSFSQPVMLLGDGAELCMKRLGHLPGVRLAPERVRHQRAGAVALLAREQAKAGRLTDGDALGPVYLRLPQAERERLEKLNGERNQTK